MLYTIDRFEGDFAVCEDESKHMTDISRSLLPEGCKEGDKVEETNGVFALVDNCKDKVRIKLKMDMLFGGSSNDM